MEESIVEFFLSANKALELSRIVKDTKVRYVLGEIEALDKDIRKRIAHSSPYFDSNVNDRVQKVYEILTTIRLINNKEIEGNEADVVTNLLWLNEELYFLNDDLEK